VSEPAIRCAGLRKDYPTATGRVEALRGIDLEVAAGESLAITGPSGCGKSTLLNVLGALDRPTAGAVRVAGRDLAGAGAALSPRERALFRRAAIGFVFQQFRLIPTLTAAENAALPLHYAGAPRAEQRRRAGALLERVGLVDRGDHLPAMLSGGEQQRVAIARALVHDPRVVLADEPTGNLDGETARQVVALLQDATGAGTSLLVVTHDPEVAAALGRRLRLREGRVEG